MTEAEWLNSKEPEPMLRYLLGLRPDELRVQAVEAFPDCRGSDRKLRLFACACYHRISDLLPDPYAKAAVEVAERVADALLPSEDLAAAEIPIRRLLDALEPQWRAACGVERETLLPTHEALALGLMVLWQEPQKAAYYAASNAHLAFADLDNPGVALSDSRRGGSQRAEERAQCDLLRRTFRNPFRPVSFAAEWRTSTVVALAKGIYEERAFDRLPLLMDALMDAGCAEEEVLGHCRVTTGHHRGCWLVDLVLDKRVAAQLPEFLL